MAIDPIGAVHSSAAAQKVDTQNADAVDRAQRNPNPQSSPAPRDRVTISPAAQAKQTPSVADRDHDGDRK